jgi:hypothetical protein
MIHANTATRLTLYGLQEKPLARWTLQEPDTGGRGLSFDPQAKYTVGAKPLRRRVLQFQGWRMTLTLTWSLGLVSLGETWDGTAWSAPRLAPTALAVSQAIQASRVCPILVEPFLADPWPSFRGVATSDLVLADIKGIAHAGLSLALEAEVALPTIPINTWGQEDSLGWGLGPWRFLKWGD